MFDVSERLLEAALTSLQGWYESVVQQKARHVFALFPVLVVANGERQAEYFESDDDRFLQRYLSIPGAEDSHPFFDPFSSSWLPKSYAHSNMATFRKRTFFRSWGAGSWIGDQITLSPDYATIFQAEALTKAGVVHRIPAWAFAVWIATVTRINHVDSPDWPGSRPATAPELADLLRGWLGMSESDWAHVFDDSPNDAPVYETQSIDSDDDRVDVSSLLQICLAAAPAPPDTSSVQQELGADSATRPSSSSELASRLFLPPSTIDDMLWLLQDRRSLIFTGPPGVGKTFVARQLAHYFGGDQVSYVQFHASYSYEYFVSGYRPVAAEDHSVQYRVVPGPLLTAVKRALDSPGIPSVLVIDEINRANVGAVFGELLSGLEYRNQPVALQYSEPGKESSLVVPDNFYILGTMNRSDRSAVSFDAAIRRRFAFFECSPVQGPFEPVLREYLAAKFPNGEHAWIAEWVAALNSRIPDVDFAVGGSYFFGRADLSLPTVRRVYSYEIAPFLRGHFGDDVLNELEQVSHAYFEEEQLPKSGQSLG